MTYKPEWLISEIEFEPIEEQIEILTEALRIVLKLKLNDVQSKTD